MSEKIIIWALFDDANGSWNKFAREREREHYISIGINNNDWENYYKIDLSIQNDKLIKELEKLPKPDIIVASPPCESWSIADNQQRLWRKQQGNNIEVFTKANIEHNNKIMNKNRYRDYYKQWRTTLNGISTILGTLKIIDYFKPKYWVIENPATSKIWEFINENVKLEGYKNKCYYNAYNTEFTKKPTIFMSNIKMNLKIDNIKQHRAWEAITNYAIRSSIPKELLGHIMEEIWKREFEEADNE